MLHDFAMISMSRIQLVQNFAVMVPSWGRFGIADDGEVDLGHAGSLRRRFRYAGAVVLHSCVNDAIGSDILVCM